MAGLIDNVGFVLRVSGLLLLTSIALIVLKIVYNISPLHPLSKYPGPLLWRASRLPASYHHAKGTLYQQVSAFHAQYGPTIRLAPDELSFTSPEAWPQIYNSRPQLQKSQYHFPPGDPDRLPESMITLPDVEHARLRRLTGPAFSNSSIFEVEPVIQRYADLLCSQLKESSKDGESQNVVDWFLWTLNDVIGQLSLNQEFQCLEKRRLHPWPSFLMGSLKQVAAVNQFRRFGMPLKALNALMTQDMMDRRDNFLETAKTSLDTRLAQEDEFVNNGEKRRPDIVGLMLREMKGGEKLDFKELQSNAMLIVAGGSETTSTCLSATVYHLCKTTRVMRKLKDEIRGTFASPEDITIKACNNLPYLKATIDESLRIFPVASYITPRITPKGGHVINGEVVPGGTYVSVGQWYQGRSERFFDDAAEFKPERWLEESSQKQSTNKPPVDDILKPFSLGPRNCVGKILAISEARLVTAKLLWHFDIELDEEHKTWVEDARFYILWQLQPLRVKLTPVAR